jgi:hypothetical protein
MRKSSQIGFGVSLGLAIISASFVSDFSAEPDKSYFLSQASASILSTIVPITDLSVTSARAERQMLSNEIRRRALVNSVHQKLISKSDMVSPILL